jgi:hypothetical protein
MMLGVQWPTWYNVALGLPAIAAATGWIIYIRFFVVKSSLETQAGMRPIETALVRCVLLYLSTQCSSLAGFAIGFLIFFEPGVTTTLSDGFWNGVFVGVPLAVSQVVTFVLLGWPIVRDARVALRRSPTEGPRTEAVTLL